MHANRQTWNLVKTKIYQTKVPWLGIPKNSRKNKVRKWLSKSMLSHKSATIHNNTLFQDPRYFQYLPVDSNFCSFQISLLQTLPKHYTIFRGSLQSRKSECLWITLSEISWGECGKVTGTVNAKATATWLWPQGMHAFKLLSSQCVSLLATIHLKTLKHDTKTSLVWRWAFGKVQFNKLSPTHWCREHRHPTCRRSGGRCQSAAQRRWCCRWWGQWLLESRFQLAAVLLLHQSWSWSEAQQTTCFHVCPDPQTVQRGPDGSWDPCRAWASWNRFPSRSSPQFQFRAVARPSMPGFSLKSMVMRRSSASASMQARCMPRSPAHRQRARESAHLPWLVHTSRLVWAEYALTYVAWQAESVICEHHQIQGVKQTCQVLDNARKSANMKFGEDQDIPNKSSLAGDPKKQQKKQGTQVTVKKHAVTQVSNNT